MVDIKRSPSPAEISKNFVKHNWIQPFYKKPFLPRTLCFYVTHRCDSHCVMCGLWKQEPKSEMSELSLGELERIFSDPLFSKIKHFDINGGEPTLREDLIEIAEIIIQKFPHLKHITMSTNGISTERITSVVKDISEISSENNIRFSVGVSLHGVGNVAEKVSRVNRVFSKVARTINQLKSIQEQNSNSLSLNCVLMDVNLLNVYDLKNWSESEGLPVSYVLGEVRERFLNLNTYPTTIIGEDKKAFLIRFLRELAKDKSLYNPSAFRYHSLANMVEFNATRTNACHYAMGGAILGPYGELYFCPHSRVIGNCRKRSAKEIYYREENLKYRRDKLINVGCKRCPPYTLNRIEMEKDIHKYLTFLVKKL